MFNLKFILFVPYISHLFLILKYRSQLLPYQNTPIDKLMRAVRSPMLEIVVRKRVRALANDETPPVVENVTDKVT